MSKNYLPTLNTDTRFLINHNPWWNSDFKRENDPDLFKLLNKKFIRSVDWFNDLESGIYILRGPRQVGKTTAIKQKIFELIEKEEPANIFYFNATNYSNKDLGLILTNFLSLNKQMKYIFIDEISYVDNLSKLIKSLTDLGFFAEKTVVLTGSNTLDMRYEYETLPGRTGHGKRIVAKPMNFKEYIAQVYNYNEVDSKKMFTKIDFLNSKLEEFILTGGLPAVINEYLTTGKINDDVYDIYIKWILGDIEKYRFNANTAKLLLRKIVETIGSKVSWETIKEYAPISHITVPEYVDVFERTYLSIILYNSLDGKIDPKKRKKIYFVDSFFYFCVYKLVFGEINMFAKSQELLRNSNSLALLKENLVCSYLWQNAISISDTVDYKTKLFFISPKSRKETDFVFIKDLKRLFVEVKSQDTNRQLGIVLTKDKLEKNKMPISIFLLHPITYFKNFI